MASSGVPVTGGRGLESAQRRREIVVLLGGLIAAVEAEVAHPLFDAGDLGDRIEVPRFKATSVSSGVPGASTSVPWRALAGSRSRRSRRRRWSLPGHAVDDELEGQPLARLVRTRRGVIGRFFFRDGALGGVWGRQRLRDVRYLRGRER